LFRHRRGAASFTNADGFGHVTAPTRLSPKRAFAQANPSHAKMTNVALYARISSEQQTRQATVESQVAALRERAKSDGLVVLPTDVYIDEGYSGATLVRPALERLRDRAAEGNLEVLDVHSPDRLARRYAYQVVLLDEFAKHGVWVVFLLGPTGQSAENELLVQVQGMIAEYERAKILERSRRGKIHEARTGSVNPLSGAPFGYTYVRKSSEQPASYHKCHAPRKDVATRTSRAPIMVRAGTHGVAQAPLAGYLGLASKRLRRLAGRKCNGQPDRPSTPRGSGSGTIDHHVTALASERQGVRRSRHEKVRLDRCLDRCHHRHCGACEYVPSLCLARRGRQGEGHVLLQTLGHLRVH